MMIRMVGGWVFLLVLAHLGSPGQRAVKRLLLCVCLVKQKPKAVVVVLVVVVIVVVWVTCIKLMHSLCTGRLESMCADSIGRARAVIDGMIQHTVVELETGGNVRFEYGKPSDPWWELQFSVDSSSNLLTSRCMTSSSFQFLPLFPVFSCSFDCHILSFIRSLVRCILSYLL